MNSISSIEGGPSSAREAVTGADPFIPEIVRRILGFLELSPIEEHHLSLVSRTFYSALAPRPLKSMEDCIKKIAEVLPGIRDQEMRESFKRCQERLISLNETQESALSKEARMFEELLDLKKKIEQKRWGDGQVDQIVYEFLEIPTMATATIYYYVDTCKQNRKFEEWAEEKNFRIPSVVFKKIWHQRNLFLREFVIALLDRGNAEGALEVFPSIKEFMTDDEVFAVLCKGYNPPEFARGVLPTIFEKDFFLVYLSGRLHDLNHPKAEEIAAQIVGPKEALEYTYRFDFHGNWEVYRNCAVNCLFLVCKRYIRENELERAFALMQHLIGVAKKLGLEEGVSFEKVAALFVQQREFCR